MALANEWRKRISKWLAELEKEFYSPIGKVDFSYFATKDALSPAEAQDRAAFPAPAGLAWGAKWEYGWFSGKLVLPESCAGERIALVPDFGAEALVFVDGKAAGTVDKEHFEISLAMRGEPGRSYSVLAEAYAGHGPRLEDIGPVRPGQVAVPEPGPAQARVGESSFGIWDDLAFRLWIDAELLFQLRNCLPEASLRVSEIDSGLRDFACIVDFELSLPERRKTYKAARERLAPLLACRNGSTAPLFHIFGQSHLDLAWLWPWAETRRKAARTMANQLALLDEYPRYRFLLCQVPLFLALKEDYPELYSRLAERVAEGRIIVDGAMWLEPDTNLSSGESLIRQIHYGKKFYKEEFGLDSQVLWLPDSFGFSAALPQIMAGCGVESFATKKIADTYNARVPFPHTIFKWRGIDGSEVLTHVYRKCNSSIEPKVLLRRWNEDRKQRDGISVYLQPFGYGDGGGGPTRALCECAERIADVEGLPRTVMSSPGEFFEDVRAKCPPGTTFAGELYFPEHRGTYTSQAKLKRFNRRAEFALREAEFWGAAALAAWALPGAGTLPIDFSYPAAEMERLWKLVLFNQFHDVVTGTSIRRVVEEAEASYARAIDGALATARRAAESLAGEGKVLLAFNSLPWGGLELVEVPEDMRPLARAVPESARQEIEGRLLVEAELPPCGWAPLSAPSDGENGGESPGAGRDARRGSFARASADGRTLENELLLLELDESGGIRRLFDKEEGRELLSGRGNEFRMFKDTTTTYDAWDIDSAHERMPVPLDPEAEIERIAGGPLAAVARVRRVLGSSPMSQDIVLRRGSRTVEFRTSIDWREGHRLLKVAFPTGIRATEALFDIQFGYLKRPNHKSLPQDEELFEVPHHKWCAIADGGRGMAVLNDCKYGSGVLDDTISLSLLKSPYVPDMEADRGGQEFTYALHSWNGPIAASGLVREAYRLNRKPLLALGGARALSLFSLDDPGIVIETAKPAFDGSGDIVLRLYESLGASTICRLKTSLDIAKIEYVDMLEGHPSPAPWAEGRLRLEFRPFEVKTLKAKLGNSDGKREEEAR